MEGEERRGGRDAGYPSPYLFVFVFKRREGIEGNWRHSVPPQIPLFLNFLKLGVI
jgi:hypothetical protein